MIRALLAAATSAVEPAHEAAGAGGHSPSEILMHHVVDEKYGHLLIGGLDLGPTKHLYFLIATSLIVLGLARLAIRGYREGGVPTGVGALLETFVVFIRDELAEKNIGHDGRKFTPILCSFFFFILIAALIGLLPFSATGTGNISVTLALAGISFAITQWAGISKYGVVHHFGGMIPKGLPAFLVPIMVPVELLAMFAKPFALTVRLFANMLAGHMIVTSLLLLIPLMFGVSTLLGVAIVPISLGISLFIKCLEILVAVLQAFIFTLLTSIFIGMSAHPSH